MAPQLSSFVHCSFGFDLTERRYHEHYDTSDSCPRVRRGEECNAPLGLEDLIIEDSQLSQSSGSGKAHAHCARLNNQHCAWCPPSGNGQFLQLDLKHDFHITGISTQGFLNLKDYYVKKYNVSHSKDGKTWSFFPEVINGNHDGRSVEKHNFSSPINAQFIRVHPIAHKGKICLRMELYGCSNPSSALSTTTSSTTLSGANYTTPQNVARGTVALSAEKTTMIQPTTDQTVGSGKIMTPTSGREETEKVTTQMANDDSKRQSSKTWIIVVGVIAVILIIFLVVWCICFRKRTDTYRCDSRNKMRSEEEAQKFCAVDLEQLNGL